MPPCEFVVSFYFTSVVKNIYTGWEAVTWNYFWATKISSRPLYYLCSYVQTVPTDRRRYRWYWFRLLTWSACEVNHTRRLKRSKISNGTGALIFWPEACFIVYLPKSNGRVCGRAGARAIWSSAFSSCGRLGRDMCRHVACCVVFLVVLWLRLFSA